MSSTKAKLRFLSSVMGNPARSTDGINYAFRCPSCKNKDTSKKKLVIRLDNDHFHCWVCDYRGRKLSSIFRKYFPSYLQKYELEFLGKKLSNKESADVALQESVTIPKEFSLLANMLNCIDPDIQKVIKYARSRGITDRDMWYFKFGTCSTGKYRRRLIMPSFDDDGNLNYIVARAIDNTAIRKYINARVPKKDVIFNEINIRWDEELTIVEGPLDLVKSNYNSVCLLGSSLNESYALFKKIVRNKTPVLLALDPDAITKSHKIAKLLASYDIRVRILEKHSYDDVGAMSKDIFSKFRLAALPWCENDRLYHLIGGIKSGSVI